MKYIILLVYLLGNYFSLCAEINVIPEREYFTTVQQLLAEAKNSIEVEMYLVHSNSKEGAMRRERGREEVTLLGLVNSEKDKECLFIPPEFWTLGWIRKLSGSGLYFYLVNLAEFKKSPYKPVWLNSQRKLSREYGIRLRTIHSALKELVAYNLIEVQHDIPDPDQSFNERKANRYFINPLWREEELSQKWTKLAEREGLDLVLKARCLAARINEPNDLQVVSSLITFSNIYGLEAVTKVVDKVTRLSFANGKWEITKKSGECGYQFLLTIQPNGCNINNGKMKRLDMAKKIRAYRVYVYPVTIGMKYFLISDGSVISTLCRR